MIVGRKIIKILMWQIDLTKVVGAVCTVLILNK